MGRRKSRGARPITEASKLTVVVDDPVSMWAKLAWDVDVFREVQGSYPDEIQPLAYAAINACIAAWSLRNWVECATARRARDAGLEFDRNQFYSDIEKEIPKQRICEAIANTAKHARLGDEKWLGGKVEISYQKGDEDCPSGFVIYHVTEGREDTALAINNLINLCDDWWQYLSRKDFTDGKNRTPDWQQNKLNRIFGHFSERQLPAT